ncbi:hypothetical protein BUH_4353 [Burkholderia pseudomallei Pakistan 9]|nr:hypothetical protein BUH_4353 [Burkholderia pseudomallei Pakistan 9]
MFHDRNRRAFDNALPVSSDRSVGARYFARNYARSESHE